MKYKTTLILFTICISCMIMPASAWLTGYDYRVPIEINNTGNNLIYFQYNFTMDTATEISIGNMSYSDGRDLRITDINDNLLPFWNETAFNLSDTKIWVNATSLGNVSNTTHYAYYGNLSASSVTDISTMGLFGDSFEGTSLCANLSDRLTIEFTKAIGNYSCHGTPSIAENSTDEFWVSWHYDPNSSDGTSGCNVTKMVLFSNNNTNSSLEWVTQYANVQESPAQIVKIGDEYYSFFGNDRAAIYGGPWDIRYKNSSDGISWSDMYELGTEISTGRAVPKVVQINDTTWWIVYNNKNATSSSIRYIEFNTTTKAFSSEIDIVVSTTSAWTYMPFGVYNYTNDEHFIYYWQAGSPHSVRVVNKTGDGAWSSPTTITTVAVGYASPWVIEWRSKFFMFYYDTNYDIKIMDSTDGISFSAFQTLHSHASNYYWYPGVAPINSTHLAMVYAWHDPVGLGRIVYWDILKFTEGTTGRWDETGNPDSVTVSNGILNIDSAASWSGIKSVDSFGIYDIAIRGRVKYAGAKCQYGMSNIFPDMYTASDTMSFLEYDSSLYIRTRNDGGNTDTAGVSENSNYHIDEASWKSGEVKLYRDGSLKATHTTNVPDELLNVGIIGRTDYIYADWVFVRKYVDTEPTASLGTVVLVTTKPIISLLSFYPTPLNTNYTGTTTISYMVESTNPLNLSSLAFLYGLNYTITGDMHNYIGVPPCDIGYEGIYRAPNRNITPYLSWEFNDTITEGNVWQWGGGDNNSWWISKNPINATHTYINATGVTQHVLPSSFYLKKTAMYSAPKTGFEINRLQGIIIKMWNVEEIRNRNANYFANMYFDTSWESTLPTHPVEVGFCNFSYDPTVDDIDTSPNCTTFGEWDGNRWINHSWVPGPNASYTYPFVVNASQFTEPIPTDINYIWLRSNTISSKSYILNATDHDPGITNITFAETNTMWTYNELNGVTTPVAYTPSFFTTFVRDYEELLHHLYIADDTGIWGHSEIFNETIGLSSVPVQPVSFEHFNITCQGDYIEDTLMDATYDEGSILVNIHCHADPDGGIVSHNLTLHYYTNQTLVAVINDTFTTTGDEYVDINFTTTPYYSSSDFYTLRCVSTDDENDVATKWLISYFTLDADGNQGWVVDDKLLFWGMNDIPTLYATVANDSLISYNAGNDIYTMHVPFFKSKSNDTFRFNETVHLESLNNEDVAYFRHSGETIFDYATIYAWNTTTDIAAPITDEYRGYVYSHFHVCGNITNSDFSHLGSDFYRQEGLNFIDNPHEYLIYNTTFSHNAEGPVMEYCSNMNISECTITDNVNVGIGIYFSNSTTVENNTISSNGGRGISIYEGYNNIINYNAITNSGVHGIHLWSNSGNNTATANSITGSALYDYYLSSSSTENYIIDSASTTDRIRVTSTSSVNIENTDNAVFSEDSLNTSYAYLTNFSMYVSGASQTFYITQYDMTIVPSNDNLSIQDFEWGNTIQFNAESSTGVNQTWINITNTRWKNEQISIFIGGLPYNISHADDNGTLEYNYSVSIGDNFFEFILTIPPSPVPVSVYIFMGVLLFVFCGASFILTGIPSIFTSILSIMFSFIMSKIAVNGSLVQNIGGISSTGAVVQGVTRIEIPALSYILIFVGLFMVVILAVQVLREIKFRESKDTIELDL